MPKIITIAHQKGGVGKSTLALNLAYAFMAHAKTAIIDIDPQGTISSLKEMLPDGAPEIVTAPGRIDEIAYSDKYQIVIIDTPPYNSNQLNYLFGISDLVLIPTKAGIPDVLAIARTIAIYKDGCNISPAPGRVTKAGIVLNMVKSNSSLNAIVKAQLEQYNLPMMGSLGDRVSFAKSVLAGGIEATGDKRAIAEMNELVNNILSIIE